MPEASPYAKGPWPGGINNRANEKAVPAGFIRDGINIDPSQDGVLRLRSGFTRQASATNLRGVLSVGQYILMADGESLRCFDSATNSTTTLRSIAGAGRFSGGVFNEELFFCTENETLRFKAGVLRNWGVDTVSAQPVPSVVNGGLLAGEYQCAVTFVDAYGDEGGTTLPLGITVPADSGLMFDLPAPPVGGSVRLYVSTVQGGELYLQFEGTGRYICTSVSDDSARLETLFRRGPVPGDFVCEHNAVLAIADGNTLWLTDPLRPHLRDQAKRFFQYPAPIDGIVSADGGLFVLADKTYFIQNIETDEPVQADILPHGGVRGSMMKFSVPADDPGQPARDFAVWMTHYGLAKTTGGGNASFISSKNFLPELASHGSSGMVERNGDQLIVTTMHRTASVNPLRASDYTEAEIVSL